MIPRFELSENQRIWLQEAWDLLKLNGQTPSFRILRLNTRSKTGDEFIPYEIHKWLITQKCTEITLLGISHLDEGTKVLHDAERILLYIRQELLNGGSGEFKTNSIAGELGLEELQVRILLNLLTEFDNVYNGASGSSGTKNTHSRWDYNEYRMTGDETFDAYMSFSTLNEKIEGHYARLSKYEILSPFISDRIGNNDLWLDSNGTLQFSDDKMFGRVALESKIFIAESRVKELIQSKTDKYDLLKLLHLCKEINFNHMYGNYYAVALLTRALIDHVPPVFSCKSFGDVANHYVSENNAKSFKKSMLHLDKSLRNIGDSLIHSQIRKSEIAPNSIQIDFKNDLDVLLAEVVRLLKQDKNT